MDLGVILPHTLLFGGVKRFLELGNIFIESGHSFTVYTPDALRPEWFDFKGEIKLLETLPTEPLDAIFFTESCFLEEIQNSIAKRKIFYRVSKDKQIKKLAKLKTIELLACSTNVYEFDKKYGITDFKAIGGVNLANYNAKTDYTLPTNRPLYILAYGRLATRSKGTKYIIKACEKLYKKGFDIKLLLFDTPVNSKGKQLIAEFSAKVPYEFILNQPLHKNSEIYNRADIFVAAEGRAGWSNTVAEAMACGVPVIATSAGTKDLLFDKETGLLCRRNSFSIRRKIKTLIKHPELREVLGKNGRKTVENFDWHQLAQKIEEYLKAPAPTR